MSDWQMTFDFLRVLIAMGLEWLALCCAYMAWWIWRNPNKWDQQP